MVPATMVFVEANVNFLLHYPNRKPENTIPRLATIGSFAAKFLNSSFLNTSVTFPLKTIYIISLVYAVIFVISYLPSNA